MKKHERKARAALEALHRLVKLYDPETISLGAHSRDVASWFRDPGLVKLPIEVREFEPVLFVWDSHIPQDGGSRHETALFTATQVLQPNSFAMRGTYGEIKVSIARVVSMAEVYSFIRQDELFAGWLCSSVSQLFWRIRQARYSSQISFGKTFPRTSVEYIQELVPHPR